MMRVALLALLAVANAIPWDEITPLDEYVHADDGFYSYEIVTSYRYEDACTLYIVNMTSQKWMDESFSDKPFWTHWMGVAIPDSVNITHPDAAFLFISGGDNDDPVPGDDIFESPIVCNAALDMGGVGGWIRQMPNQHITFYNDPTLKSRREDGIIAWTWRTFFDDPNEPADPTVIARFPMTRAAKRAMDCIHDVAQEVNPELDPQRFMVTGPSKRGWTTWSIAATDQRVIAIAPLVFSMLKANETLQSHYRSLGGAWSFAFGPYYDEDLTKLLLDEDAQDAFLHEDMWFYRERLTLPILQITSTGDEFFLLQDSHQWWDDIPDPKWNLMLENAEHTMFPHYTRIYETMVSFCIAVLEEIPLPTVTWDRGETADGGYVDLFLGSEAEEVEVFRAVTLLNDTTRDFRLATGNSSIGIDFHPVVWTDRDATLTQVSPTHWRAESLREDDEWVGLMLRARYSGPTGYRMYFTSEVQVIPDTFPVDACTNADECYGTLV